jgi:hypothetical protein
VDFGDFRLPFGVWGGWGTDAILTICAGLVGGISFAQGSLKSVLRDDWLGLIYSAFWRRAVATPFEAA